MWLFPRFIVSADVLDRLAAAHFVGAPARADAVRPANEDRFDPPDQAVLDLEQFAQLPAPVYRAVVEERKRKDNPPLLVNRNKASVANTINCPNQRGLELFGAALNFLASHADCSRRSYDDHPVLIT